MAFLKPKKKSVISKKLNWTKQTRPKSPKCLNPKRPTGLKQQFQQPGPKSDNFAMDNEKTIYRKMIPNDLTDYEWPEKLIIKRLKSQPFKKHRGPKAEHVLVIAARQKTKKPIFLEKFERQKSISTYFPIVYIYI